MANKRIKKKIAKRNQQRNNAARSIDTSRPKRGRHVNYTDKWVSAGVDIEIIRKYQLHRKSSVSESELQFYKSESKKIRAARTRERNKARRKQELLEAGIPEDAIKPKWLTSDKLVAEVIENFGDIVYHANLYLGVSFTNLHGAELMIFNYENMEIDRLKDLIARTAKVKMQSKGGSNGMTAAFQIFYGSKDEVEEMQSYFGERGYNLQVFKFMPDKYSALFNRNDWTKREFAALIYLIIRNCPNDDVFGHLADLKNYCIDSGLPFTDLFEF